MRTDRNKLIIEIQDNFIPCNGIFSDPFEKDAHEIATYIAHYLDPQAHESHQFGRYVAEACWSILKNASLKHAPEGWDLKDLYTALVEVAESAEQGQRDAEEDREYIFATNAQEFIMTLKEQTRQELRNLYTAFLLNEVAAVVEGVTPELPTLRDVIAMVYDMILPKSREVHGFRFTAQAEKDLTESAERWQIRYGCDKEKDLYNFDWVLAEEV
jgi:hypothetical protein